MQRLASDLARARAAGARAVAVVAALRRALARPAGALSRGLLRTTRLAVPVLVVGNLIAGGAGKTPTVIATLALLRRAAGRPGSCRAATGGARAACATSMPPAMRARSATSRC